MSMLNINRNSLILCLVAVAIMGLSFVVLKHHAARQGTQISKMNMVELDTEWKMYVRRRWTAEHFADQDLKAMFAAITSKDLNAVQRLLDRGISPNLSHSDGTTPLLLAFHYDIAIFRLLLSRGADPSVPIHVEFHTHGMINPGDSVLFLSVFMDGNWFEVLTDYQFDINTRGYRDDTLMHRLIDGLISRELKIARVNWLIDNGINLHLKNKFGDTPLYHALKRLYGVALLEPLIENDGTPHTREEYIDMLSYVRRGVKPHDNKTSGTLTTREETLQLLENKYLSKYGEHPPLE